MSTYLQNPLPIADATPQEASIEIRLAVPADNGALLSLTRATPMAGTIALRIDRDPDFFALLRARGEAVVFVATCEGRVIGCMSAAIHIAYVCGVPERIAHAGDLKVHPDFTGRKLSLRLIRALEAHLRAEGVDLCFSLVAEGNHRVLPISTGKFGTPAVVHLGKFIVRQLLPSPFRKKSGLDAIEQAAPGDLPEIGAMLDSVYRTRIFAPLISKKHLEPAIASTGQDALRKVLLVRRSGRIAATVTIEDTSALRQNVLMGVPPQMRAALAVARIVASPIPALSIPCIGRPLTMLYLRHIACAEGHEEALQLLISEARAEAFRRRFTFLSIGLHERDPLQSAFARIPCLTFHSLAMATSLMTPDRVRGLVSEIPFEDFALV